MAFVSLGFAMAALADVSADDRKFVENAAKGGMAEVELGKVATARGSSMQVRQFGQRLVNEHRKANEELKRLAKGKGIELPAALDAKHRQDVEELKKKDAKKFDREYLEMMVKDHRKDVAEFQKAAKGAKDPDIKAFASKSLPIMKDHLQLALEWKAALPKNPGK
jgi:putative membrane protein